MRNIPEDAFRVVIRVNVGDHERVYGVWLPASDAARIPERMKAMGEQFLDEYERIDHLTQMP